MSRQKTIRKAQFDGFPNCLNDDRSYRGRWNSFFGNDHPLTVELACGKADLMMGLAQLHPDQNFIGIDVKAVRMWVAARIAIEKGMKNVGFLRAHIESLPEFFGESEISGLWITFPDPFPRSKHERRRLTGSYFLNLYGRLLKPGGIIQFKTDNDGLFEWTLEHFESLQQAEGVRPVVEALTRDLHNSELKNEENGITTDFERRFLAKGKSINYMRFRLEGTPIITAPAQIPFEGKHPQDTE